MLQSTVAALCNMRWFECWAPVALDDLVSRFINEGVAARLGVTGHLPHE
nr:hypothetical protein [Endozoicomonas sp.]